MTAGEKYQVVVEQILPIGAVVRMPNNTTELIHISQIANAFIDSVDNFVVLGQEYEAEVVEGQGKKPIQLSLKHLNLKNMNAPIKPYKPHKPRTNDNPDNSTNRYNNYKKPAVKHPSQIDYAKTKQNNASLDDMLKKVQRDYEDKTRTRSDAFRDPHRKRRG